MSPNSTCPHLRRRKKSESDLIARRFTRLKALSRSSPFSFRHREKLPFGMHGRLPSPPPLSFQARWAPALIKSCYWHKPFSEAGFAFGGNSGVFAESPDRILIAQRGEIRLPDPLPAGYTGFAGSLGSTCSASPIAAS